MAKKNNQKNVKITMTYKQLITEFHPAITSLGSLKVKDISSLISIGKAKKMADETVEEFNDLRKKIAEQDCVKYKKTGQPKIVDNMYEYPNEDVQIETNTRLIELESKEITFDLMPVNVQKLRNVEGLTANTIVAVREFIEE